MRCDMPCYTPDDDPQCNSGRATRAIGCPVSVAHICTHPFRQSDSHSSMCDASFFSFVAMFPVTAYVTT